MRSKITSIVLTTLLVVLLGGIAQASGDAHPVAGGLLLKDFLYRVLNFALVVALLVYFLRKPIKKGLSGRSEGIEKALADAKKAKEEAEAKFAEYDLKLAQATAEIAEISAAIQREGELEKQKIIENAKEMAIKIGQEAEKAAVEKAAKKAAEKAAAEQAAKEAAEKAAAEREAAEKATMKKVIFGLASGFIILLALIFSASSSNNSKYYIKESAGVLEIWQGRYAPLGEERMMSLPGVPLPEQINAVYSKTEVFPLIFNYYIDKADAISGMSDTPDYVAIKSYLNEALLFATTGDLSKKAYSRLNNIKFNDLMYKAGVAESRGAISDLDEAMRYLGQASLLKVDAGKSDVVKQKIESIKKQKEIFSNQLKKNSQN